MMLPVSGTDWYDTSSQPWEPRPLPTNPVVAAAPPRRAVAELRPPTPSEVLAILEAADRLTPALAVFLLLAAGNRRTAERARCAALVGRRLGGRPHDHRSG